MPVRTIFPSPVHTAPASEFRGYSPVTRQAKKMKKVLSTAAKLSVTVLLLWWITRQYNVSIILDASPAMVGVALGIFVLSNLVGALQWKLLLQGQNIRFPYGRAVKLYFIGLFFNNFLPGALGGDVVKVYSISRVEKRGREGLAATFVDRFAGFFLLALFALTGSGWLLVMGAPAVKQDIVNYIFLVFGIFILATAVIFSRRVSNLIYEVILARFKSNGLVARFREGHEFFHLYRSQHALAAKVFLLSFAIQLLRISVHYFCALSIGFEIEFIYFLIFVPLIALVAIVPISFGGVGVRETMGPPLFTSVASVAAITGAADLAAVTQLLATLVGIGVGLIGGVVFVLTRETAGEPAVEAADRADPDRRD